MGKCKILIPYGGRSNEAITKPLIEQLEKEDWCQLNTIKIESGNFIYTYEILIHYFGSLFHMPDLIYIAGDRIEMMACSLAAYHNNIPIAHYGGGIIEGISTFDEVHRHSITMMADIELCESVDAARNIANLWITTKRFKYTWKNALLPPNVYEVGNMYLEGLDNLDESLVPQEPYDLVLINYEPKNSDQENIRNYEEAIESIKEKRRVFIGGNANGRFGGTYIRNKQNDYYENVPRSKFLGLQKNCQRYITNSSSVYYESDALGLKPEQIIMIGERNKNRSTPKKWNQEYKTSDRICEILKQWWLEKNDL